jgi:hypothetical protein
VSTGGQEQPSIGCRPTNLVSRTAQRRWSLSQTSERTRCKPLCVRRAWHRSASSHARSSGELVICSRLQPSFTLPSAKETGIGAAVHAPLCLGPISGRFDQLRLLLKPRFQLSSVLIGDSLMLLHSKTVGPAGHLNGTFTAWASLEWGHPPRRPSDERSRRPTTFLSAAHSHSKMLRREPVFQRPKQSIAERRRHIFGRILSRLLCGCLRTDV